MKRSADDRDLRKLPSATDAKLVFMSKAERRRREEVVAELPSISSTKTKTKTSPKLPSLPSFDGPLSPATDATTTGRGTGTATETAIGTVIVASETVSARACAELERDKELDHIREQYLGSKKPNKRVINKPSEKFRFSFEWENTEDTFRDINALYQNTHEARLLFGRGFIAGSDRREHKKQAALHEKETREEIRRKEGVEERPQEAAADLYDTFDMRVERHWSEKKIEEMIERDWRVFMILSGAFDVAAEEGVPEEDAGLVDIVEQVAGVGHVSARHQRKKDPCEEAVLAGEAGGEEKGVDL